MTHSLHRHGTVEDLEYDYCILMQTFKGNVVGSAGKIRTFLELCHKHNAVNLGIMEAGSILNIGYDRVLETVADGTSVQAVFSNQDDVTHMLKDLVELDLGISIVVQGLVERIGECARGSGTRPHTWNNSLGAWGRTDLLPEPDVLSATTMCGHGLIAVSLVKDAVEKLRKGKLTVDQAVAQICRPCICGMANPVRLERVVTRLVQAQPA